jgi:hypothetical protein
MKLNEIREMMGFDGSFWGYDNEFFKVVESFEVMMRDLRLAWKV